MKSRCIRAWLAVALGWAIGVARAAGIVAELPSTYTPSVPFVVTLPVQPDPGTQIHAVEDAPPAHWTVSAISHGGGFDPVTGKVKWGPFLDATPRVLQYTAVPSADADGVQSFVGLAVFDSVARPIVGNRSMVRFPGTAARTAPADYLPGTPFEMQVAVVPAASVGAWATEDRVPDGWNVTGISHGGWFDVPNHTVKWGPYFDANPRALTYTVVSPAASRDPVDFEARVHLDQAVLIRATSVAIRPSRLDREIPPTYDPGVGFVVRLVPIPAPYVGTVAIEETLPAGSSPADITGPGTWDPVNRKIKWGPFFGLANVPSGLSYRFTPGSDATQPLVFSGVARMDAASVGSDASVDRYLLHPESRVVRSLPALYRPGQAVAVTLAAVPKDTTQLYAVVETVPDGWLVSGISHGGVFDAANRKVKWGPFLDAVPINRNLTYTTTPPAGAYGSVVFSGTGVFDGIGTAVSGPTVLANAPATASRAVSARYVPTVGTRVTITVVPVAGIQTHAVEESLPAGWTATAISDGGVFDVANRRIKWGPYFDTDSRPLSYVATPPPDAVGVAVFAGSAWFNGTAVAVSGPASAVPDRVPVAASDTVARPPGAGFRIAVTALLANDTDPDGDALDVVGVAALSAHGARVELSWPWITYTASGGYSGADTFDYTIGDGFGGTSTATVSLTATAEVPARLDPPALDSNGRVRIQGKGSPAGAYDIEVSGDTVVWSRLGGTAAGSDGRFSYEDANATKPAARFYRAVRR